MIFQQLLDPVSSTFTYVLASRVGGDALIIDPVYEHVDIYLSLLQRLQLRLDKALDTHIHADHISALGALRDMTKCVTIMGERSGADMISMRLKDGDELAVDGIRLRAIYTPGHTDDSYSFVMADRVFTGDTLLIGGTGRTDFQNGDSRAAYDSLFHRLLSLSDATLVYPAHDYNGNTVSTIGFERANNLRLQVADAAAYAELMSGLRLPNPKMMDVAVPANRAMGRTVAQFLQPGDELDAETCRRNARAEELLLIDLREEGERARDGAIPDSVHVPYGTLARQIKADGMLSRMVRDHPGKVVFYCAFGERSALALHSAREAGLGGIRHLAGGMGAWLRAGGAVEPIA